jgi:hypothetical protein
MVERYVNKDGGDTIFLTKVGGVPIEIMKISENGTLTTNSFSGKIRTVTSSVPLNQDDFYVLVSSSSPTTITLPLAATSGGKVFTVKSIGTGVVTITPLGGLIDGAANFLLNTQYQGATFGCDGGNWFVLNTIRISFFE